MSQPSPNPGKSPSAMLITGAARRIGKALALAFAADGWAVCVHYNGSKSSADELVAEIEAAGGRAAAVQADLMDQGAINALVPACVEQLGPLTCLINNASAFLFDEAGTLTGDGWDAHLDINLKAPVFLAKAFAAQLRAGGTGNVINIVDQRVWRLSPDFFSYTISKSGLWTATQMLAQALAPQIRVNAIAPGPVLKSVHQSDGVFEAERASTPLGRGTSPGEIAAAIRFILDAPAMTGQMIALDGGQHLAWNTAAAMAKVKDGQE